MRTRSLAVLVVLASLTIAPVRGAAQGITVDESTGLFSYRYPFELPAARGRYQPALTLLASVPGATVWPAFACMNFNNGFGSGWSLELPVVVHDGNGHLTFYLGHQAKNLVASTRDKSSLQEGVLVAAVETSYSKFIWPAGGTNTATAMDAAGNKLTFVSTDSTNPSRPFLLTRVDDPDGNVTRYTWNDPYGSQLGRIEYNAFRTAGADRANTSSVGETGNWGTAVSLYWTTFNGGMVLDSVSVLTKAAAGPVDPATGQMIPGAFASVRSYRMSYTASATVNDTGLASIAQQSSDGGTSQLVTTFEREPSSGCLSAVISPLGARQDVTYLRSSQFGDAPLTSSYPVVKSVTTSGPAMASSTVNYWYSAPSRPATGDYRGFTMSWAQDSVTGVVRRNSWDVASKPFAGWPLKQEAGTPTSAGTSLAPPTLTPFRTLTYTHAARSIEGGACTNSPTDPGSGSYPLIPLTTSELNVRVIDGVALGSQRTTPCSMVDAWGNPTQEQIDPDTAVAGNELTVNTAYLVTANPASTCKDCVKSRGTYSGANLLEWAELSYGATSQLVKVQRQSMAGETSDTYPVVSSFSYHGNGNLASKSEGGATYTYTYDDWFQARVAKVEASDINLLAKQLVTETAFDGAGRPVLVTGPYYAASSGYPMSLKPARSFAYDGLGRLLAIARQPIGGVSVTEGLAAFSYIPPSPTSLAAVTAYQFAVPKSFQVGSPPVTEDVRQVTSFLDGLGRTIQTRERLGGATGDAAAAIVQHLTQYRVTGAMVLDGAGRATVSFAPYYSPTGNYQDLASVSFAAGGGEVVKGPVQATWASYDSQGRPVCSTVRTITTTLAAATPGSCTSSFAEDAGYARATRTVYRGTYQNGRAVLGVKTIEPRFTVPTGVAMGPESFMDAAGLLRRTTDAEGNGVSYQYDALGRATATVREAPGSTRASITSSLTLDMMGRVVTRTDPNFGGRSFTYDSLTPGLLKVARFTKTGEEIRYGYDMGRTKSVQFCSASGVCTTDADLTWDLPYTSGVTYTNTAGRVGYATNPRTTIAFSYDDSGAMVRRDQSVNSGAMGFSFTATRRADGQITQSEFIPAPGLGLPALTSFTSYDSASRPVQVQAGTSTLWSAAATTDGTGAYTALGQLGTVNVDDGQVRQTWTRGVSSGLLTAQSVTIPSAANPVVYNVTGMTYQGTRLLGYTDTVSQTTHRFWYSFAGRLVADRATDSLSAAVKGLTCVGFSTNDQFVPGPSFGNIEVVKEGSGAPVTKAYGYTASNIDPGPAGPDAPTSVGTTGLTYDAFGRVASKGGGAEVFGYDLAGRLVSVARTAGQSETLGYDPFGLPVQRTVNGQTTWYLGKQATMTSVGGVLQADVHIAANGSRVASVRVGASPRTLYLHRDRLTSVVATTLAGGVAGSTYRYTAHGALEAASGDAGDAASELGYAGTLRLTGGLLWMGARVYDPALKIFLQPDPLASHDYTYAGGDPINRWDPTGLWHSLTDWDSGQAFRNNDARFWAGVATSGGKPDLQQTPTGCLFACEGPSPAPQTPVFTEETQYVSGGRDTAWMAAAGTALNVAGVVSGLAEHGADYTAKVAPQLEKTATVVAKVAKRVGIVGSVMSVANDAAQVRLGRLSMWKLELNLGFAVIGMAGWQGFAVSTTYVAFDEFVPGGVEGVVQSVGQGVDGYSRAAELELQHCILSGGC